MCRVASRRLSRQDGQNTPASCLFSPIVPSPATPAARRAIMRLGAGSGRWRSARSASSMATSALRPSTPWIRFSAPPRRARPRTRSARVSLVDLDADRSSSRSNTPSWCCARKTTARAACSRSMAFCTIARTAGPALLLWALMLGRRAPDRRRHDHAGDQRLSAVEGLHVATPGFADAVIPITLGLARSRSSPSSSKAPPGRHRVRADAARLVRRDRRARRRARSRVHPEILAAFNPVHGLAFLGRAGLLEALLILERADAGRHRRRSDVRRSRPFRRAADPALLVRGRLSRAAASTISARAPI